MTLFVIKTEQRKYLSSEILEATIQHDIIEGRDIYLHEVYFKEDHQCGAVIAAAMDCHKTRVKLHQALINGHYVVCLTFPVSAALNSQSESYALLQIIS